MGMKTCKACGMSKAVADMHPNKSALDGIGNVCRACRRARDARHREAHRDEYRKASREWRQRNPARARELSRQHDQRLREEVISAYGGRCACCGETIFDFLTLDHINGGGSAHRKSTHGKVYTQLRREGFPDGYRVLCWNCNWAASRHGACPYHRDSQ